MPAPPYLICEGRADGLDVMVLNSIIAQKLGRDVVIEAAGGERGLGSVAFYIEMRYSTRAYFIEDRNYRSLEEVEAVWVRTDGKRFIWRRHEIENYLLDPRVVADAFASLRTTTQNWPTTLPQTPEEVDKMLQQLAGLMIEHHAGWVTGRLVKKKRAAADHRFKWPEPPLKPPAGDRYPRRQEWLDHLCQECSRVKGDCVAFAQLPDFEMTAVTALYDQVLSEAKQPDFFSSGQYLVDMAGKELTTALCEFINQQGVSNLSRADLETELINALGRQYAHGFFDPDDFSDLANRLL